MAERAKAETEVTMDDDDERVITFKVYLRGPAEFISLMRDYSPFSMGRRVMDLLPSGTREHMMNAQREQLLAMRSLVDSVLDAMVRRLEESGEKASRKPKKVDVE